MKLTKRNQSLKTVIWKCFKELKEKIKNVVINLKKENSVSVPFSLVTSHVQLFVTPWMAAHQAFLSISNSQSLLKLMSIKSVIPSNHLILCRLLLLLPSMFPSIRMSQLFASVGQSIGASALASVFPMNIQDWFRLGWTGWISLLAKVLSRASVLRCSASLTSIHDYWKNHSFH